MQCLPHAAGIALGSTLFAKTKWIMYNIFFEIITCDLSIYIMDHSYFFVCSFIENSIGPKWVNLFGNVYIAWLQGYKTFPCSTQLNTNFILLINFKMPKIVGILMFIYMVNTTPERLIARKFFICQYF